MRPLSRQHHRREAVQAEVYVAPLRLEDEKGVVRGNDWAHGFMRGMRHDGWDKSTSGA